MAKIDVLVPCHNYGRYLPACVDSILGQPVDGVRVLIIDDASTDDSAAVARRLAAADARVTAIVHARNRGHIATYNEGIEHASADYFMLLSADDLLAPRALARAVRILDEHDDVALVHGDCIEWHEGTPQPDPGGDHGGAWSRLAGSHFIWEFCYRGFNIVHTPTVVVRTHLQKHVVGGYRPHLPHSGDMEMFMRFAPHGAIARVHAVQAIKREHARNMSNPYFAEKWRDCQQRKLAFDGFFDEYADRLPDAARMRARADQEMAESAFWIGLAQLVQGRTDSGRSLLRFAFELRPQLRLRPPVSRLLREPGLLRHAAATLGGGLAHLGRRTRAVLVRG